MTVTGPALRSQRRATDQLARAHRPRRRRRLSVLVSAVAGWPSRSSGNAIRRFFLLRDGTRMWQWLVGNRKPQALMPATRTVTTGLTTTHPPLHLARPGCRRAPPTVVVAITRRRMSGQPASRASTASSFSSAARHGPEFKHPSGKWPAQQIR
jgi:hypothetical protein